MILGIDEAGRGSVIGPLVVAGVMINEEELSFLEDINVKDSKLLTPEERETLYGKIKSKCECFVKKIRPEEIDLLRDFTSLNKIEALKMCEIIEETRPERVYVDLPENSKENFIKFLKSNLRYDVEIIAEHKADRRYRIVSAASIVAKVTRDREIEKLKQHYGDFGSGYPSDPKTINFLKNYYLREKCFPPIVRTSWETIANLKRELSQRKLLEWLR